MFIDYKEEAKRLISESYEPADIISKEFQMSTADIVQHLRKILPENQVDDHLIYEALTDLKFQPKEKSPLEFYWYFKRKF